jgi:glycosyltransferase involved in cell wall biosynthesis
MQTYDSSDIALIIPTKDRPEKIKYLLTSIVLQNKQCGRIIVVDGGRNSVKGLVDGFLGRLPVEYHICHPPSQIRQRNMAISLLDSRVPLVGFIDDDIILEPHALENMLNFWNKTVPEPAGVSFNIANARRYQHSWVKGFTGMSSPCPGTILRSGYNVAIFPASQDFKSQWLCGGATVWRQDILKKYANNSVSSKWAICEDIIFSYPISKKFPLYVCANAKVRHEHVYDHVKNMKYVYYGRTAVLWRLYFVTCHSELSLAFFLWMIFNQIISRLFFGIVCFKMSDIQYAFGQIEGIVLGVVSVISGVSVLSLLDDYRLDD